MLNVRVYEQDQFIIAPSALSEVKALTLALYLSTFLTLIFWFA